MLKTCPICQREFDTARRDKKYCSDACRQKALRLRRRGIPLDTSKKPDWRQLGVEQVDVLRAIEDIKTSTATLDAGCVCGPKYLRPLCGLVSERIAATLKELGL